ncbi:MAG: peptide chain release factor N(5)-glutamine methyltransferase [Nitrospirae bacterium]|nr:peptide chain release factor N(5)-glutamine methyltransferase [Nitrospirota bacterium]
MMTPLLKNSASLQDLLRTATLSLTDAGIADARREAEALIARVLRCTRLDLYRSDERRIDPQQQEAFADLIRCRAQREPLQHLLGAQEFWALEFYVTPDVLIPRPETELLIETVLERISEPATASITVVDLGTGSGCLAVVLAKLFPFARIIATDRSRVALTIARLNAARHGVSGRIEFLEGDLFEPVMPLGLNDRIDLVLSNPPYIPTGEIPTLQPEVRLHEPRIALDGGPDGLDYYRRILPQALDLLHAGGDFYLEVGIRQADPVCGLADQTGWRVAGVKKDLSRINRVVVLTKP